jgi:hypothetical protein
MGAHQKAIKVTPLFKRYVFAAVLFDLFEGVEAGAQQREKNTCI